MFNKKLKKYVSCEFNEKCFWPYIHCKCIETRPNMCRFDSSRVY